MPPLKSKPVHGAQKLSLFPQPPPPIFGAFYNEDKNSKYGLVVVVAVCSIGLEPGMEG